MRERFEQRLFRIFAQAGYSPVQLLTITPEEMVEIPGITVPKLYLPCTNDLQEYMEQPKKERNRTHER